MPYMPELIFSNSNTIKKIEKTQKKAGKKVPEFARILALFYIILKIFYLFLLTYGIKKCNALCTFLAVLWQFYTSKINILFK